MRNLIQELTKHTSMVNETIAELESGGLVVNVRVEDGKVYFEVSERGYTSKVLATNEPALRATHKR